MNSPESNLVSEALRPLRIALTYGAILLSSAAVPALAAHAFGCTDEQSSNVGTLGFVVVGVALLSTRLSRGQEDMENLIYEIDPMAADARPARLRVARAFFEAGRRGQDLRVGD